MEKKINTNDLNLGRYASELAKEVAPIYELLQWGWYGDGIPDEEMIYEAIIDRYEGLVGKCILCSSGGLTAEIIQDEEYPDCKYIRLSFSIEKTFDLK